MASNDDDSSAERHLSPAQRRRVLRLSALALALVLVLPLYYVVGAVVPAVRAAVPWPVPFAVLALGLCVVFPATLAYAHVLSGRPDADDSSDYGVGDAWERENL